MKSLTLSTILLLALAVVLAACGEEAAAPAPENPPAAAAAATTGLLAEDYDDALTVRNQLLLGTVRLEGTPNAVTVAQAANLAPLWTAMKSLTTSGTAAEAEITALQNQIIAGMTPEQVQAIDAMQLTNTDLQAYYVEIGASTPSTPSPDSTGTPRAMSDLPQADREATRTAMGTPVGTGSTSSKGTILLDEVIHLLEVRGA